MEGRQRRSFTTTTSGKRSISWLRVAGRGRRTDACLKSSSNPPVLLGRFRSAYVGQLRVNQEVTFEGD
jgi:hypothetical protein